LYPLVNLATPENQLVKIRNALAKNGQEPGKARLLIGAPGGIRTRDQ
jgi:hypothetical protein